MRTTLHTFLLITACSAFSTLRAQTFFFVDAITLLPADPTVQDAVAVQLSGNLSGSGASVVSATAEVNGYNVVFSLVAQDIGGLSVLVPHTEEVDLGPLPAGTYTISVTGTGVDDFAAENEHTFTVSGGGTGPCDSLVIAEVQWSAFSDTTIMVHIFNPTSDIFGYPGFILLAENGDTLARETVDYFGIATESWHRLSVHPDADVPSGSFNGTLQLWSDFYSELECSWDMAFDLCPSEACSPLYPTVQNLGDAIPIGTYSYVIIDEDVPVASGTLELGMDHEVDSDTLCLPPGHYIMSLTPDQPPTGGQPYFSVNSEGPAQSQMVPVHPDSTATLVFDFYLPCIGTPQAIGAITQEAALRIVQGPGLLQVSRTDGAPLGPLRLFDARGRMVQAAMEGGSEHVFDVSGWSAGIYILQAVGANGHVASARWMLP